MSRRTISIDATALVDMISVGPLDQPADMRRDESFAWRRA
jgi:hypothetical protein